MSGVVNVGVLNVAQSSLSDYAGASDFKKNCELCAMFVGWSMAAHCCSLIAVHYRNPKNNESDHLVG